MTATPEEPRARDLVRRKEIAPRLWPGERTIRRIVQRQARRPAGCSEGLWKKVGVDDPFALPADFPKPEWRGVYASGRFVRIDQADKKPSSPGKGVPKAAPTKAPPPSPSETSAEPPSQGKGGGGKLTPEEKAARQEAEKERLRELAQKIQSKASKGQMTHTPSATKAAPSPFAKKSDDDRPKHGAGRTAPPAARSAGKGGGDALDRSPPLLAHAPSVSASGRVRSAATTPKKPTSMEPEILPTPKSAAPPTDRSPPIVPQAPPVKPTLPPPGSASPPPRAAAKPAEVPPAFVSDPPPKAPAPRPSQTAPTAMASSGTALSAAAAGKGAAKLDVGHEIKIPETQLPPGALNKLGAAQVVPLRKATKVEAEPPLGSRPEAATAPPPNRAPPKPGGGAMDDLFGGAAQEGRVRVGRAKKPTEP